MARIKVCPNCSTHNPASSSTCSKCDGDLFSVSAIDEKKYEQQLLEQQKKSQEQTNKEENNTTADNTNSTDQNNNSVASTIGLSDKDNNQISTTGKFVKICPKCKEENPPMGKICCQCNTNIKHVQRTCKDNSKYLTVEQDKCQSANTTDSIICTLTSPDKKYSFNILESEPIITIGREHKMKEYFAIRQFVSREHAKIEIIGSKIAIVDLGKPNGIFINNIKVESNSKNILRNGDKVSLGGGWPQNFEHDNTGCFIVNYP